MKTIGISVIILGLLLLPTGVAEAWYPYSPPVSIPPPVYVPQCSTYTAPGHYRQVPWYTEGGFTTFRWEWVPPTSTQICR